MTVVANQISDTDTNDPPDNMAANYVFTFSLPPNANDDTRNATGNIRIDTANSGFSVLSNDVGAGLTITAFDATSARGGQVTMNNATGTFTYNPPPGYEGPDSFTYTITGATGSDTATVNITVTDMIWFIDDSAPSCTTIAAGCGRLTNPFSDLQSFEAINGGATTNGGDVVDPEAGDNIFIYTGSYTGPLTLENSQRVIGQGAISTIPALTGVTPAADSDPLPATGGVNPTITNPSGDGITVAQNNNLHGSDHSQHQRDGRFG